MLGIRVKNIPRSHNVSTAGGKGLVSAFFQGEEGLNNLPEVTEGGRRAKKPIRTPTNLGGYPYITELNKLQNLHSRTFSYLD